MTAKLHLVFTISILFASFWSYSQDNYWIQVNRADKGSKDFIKESDFSKSQVFSVNESMLKSDLKGLSEALKNQVKVYFPDETGTIKAFYVQESSVLSPELAAKYPQIKSYSGYGVDDVKNKIRFSVSHKEVQVMLVHPEKKRASFIQKTSKNDYVVYSRNGLSKKDSDFLCRTQSKFSAATPAISTLRPVDGRVLRKYRMAISATGEYTQFHGGTVEDALAGINATMTRINQVFENDLAVTLELVANNDQIIFTDANSDPYSGTNTFGEELQATLTTSIGEANYDIGHLFHHGLNDGHAGFIAAVCIDGNKGSAYSSGSSPIGDVYDIDFVAHEMGHQLGANHTFSHEPEYTGVQVEPGSGTTIMGYAGITAVDNVALQSDDYFHYVSILQIAETLETTSCAEIIQLSNNAPVVNAVPNYVIPPLTAFKLTGDASDSDGDQLTYTWEQIDDGVVTRAIFGPNNPFGANFRSLRPTTDPVRFFPSLASVVDGDLTQTTPSVNSAWETATALRRVLDFAFTVRDNASGGGQVVSELVKVEVAGDEAFTVISQSSGVGHTAGELLEVNWNVAGTDLAPINVQSVDILLSIDGGATFPIVLAEQIPNKGSGQVILPGSATNSARIMVRSNENIFFAVNAAEFTITESAIVLIPSQTTYEVCQGENVVIPFDYETFSGFSEEVTFGVSGLPTGVSASFSPTTATQNDTQVVLTLDNAGAAEFGNYTLTLQAIGTSQTKELPLQLIVSTSEFPNVNLVSPANDTVISSQENLEWETNSIYTSYDIQIATDAGFANLTETASTFGNTYVPSNLANNTDYFWRIKPKNSCGEGDFGDAHKFTTLTINCLPPRLGTNLPIGITAIGTPTITSKVTFFDDLVLSDINVGIELNHTFLGDLRITLTSPLGKSVVLVSNSCADLNNINALFDDSADDFSCSGNPAINGVVSPITNFDSFRGDSILGEWTLTVEDLANEDGGSLDYFFLDVCVEGEPLPDADGDGVVDSNDICPGTPSGTTVDATGCPTYRFATDNFQIKATSESCRTENDGILEITASESLNYNVSITGNGVNVSDTFTTGFTRNNLEAGTYMVCFDATDGDRDYEEVCFEVVISEPEALLVSSRLGVDANSIVLRLSGSDLYTINLNGVEEQTTKSEFTLDLKSGNNYVKVSGSLVCQGLYEEQFFVASGIIVHPNPTTDFVKLFIEEGGEVSLHLYTMDGRLIRTEKRTANSSEVEWDISTVSAGTYFLKVTGQSQQGTYKIIKQ